jgi:hypothetical protein
MRWTAAHAVQLGPTPGHAATFDVCDKHTRSDVAHSFVACKPHHSDVCITYLYQNERTMALKQSGLPHLAVHEEAVLPALLNCHAVTPGG